MPETSVLPPAKSPLPIPAHNAKTYARLYDYVAAKCLGPTDVLAGFLSHLDLIRRTPLTELVGRYETHSWPGYMWRNRRRLMRLLSSQAETTTEGIRARYNDHWSAEDVRRGRKRLRDYLVGGRLYQMPELAYTPPLMQYLSGLYMRHIRPDDHVVEFGCGAGRNLMMLRQLIPEIRCEGFDQSAEGISACRDLATCLRMPELHFGVLDLTNDDDFATATAHIAPGAVLMTMGCLECVPGTADVVRRLHRLRPRLILHFEPIAELYQSAFPSRDFFIRRHLQRVGYMTTLLTTVREYEQSGQATIRELARPGFGKALVEYATLVWALKAYSTEGG